MSKQQMSIEGQAIARILPDDIEGARKAFEAAMIRFSESEVLTVLIENKAGQLANFADRPGNAGINLDALYLTGITDDLVEIAIACDNPKKAKKLIDEFSG